MVVCKVTGMVFCCCEDANNFKNIITHFWGKNHQIGQIVNSNKTEKGISKMSLLFIQAANGADKLQITK